MRTKKHLTALVCAALLTALLAGCVSPAAPTESTTTESKPVSTVPVESTTAASAPPVSSEVVPEFRFTRENFPRLDGSTACLPMAEAVCSVLLGEERESVQDLIHFNRTTQSFRNLMEGNCDLLLAGQPNGDR